MKLFFKIVAAALIFALGGCALHAPMSEIAAFRSAPPDSSVERWTTSGIAMIASMGPSDAIVDAAYAASPNPEQVEISLLGSHHLGVGHFRAGGSASRRTAGSITLGYGVVGMDFTIGLSENIYVTAGASVFGGGQIILQRRMTDRGSGATGLGLAFRYASQALDVRWIPEETFHIGPDKIIYLPSMGIRMVTLLGEGISGGVGPSQSISLFLGYLPAVHSATLSVALGFGQH